MRVHDVGGMWRAAGNRTLHEVSFPVTWNRGADTERRESGEAEGDDTVQEIGCGTGAVASAL
jgi:hypothetical protein